MIQKVSLAAVFLAAILLTGCTFVPDQNTSQPITATSATNSSTSYQTPIASGQTSSSANQTTTNPETMNNATTAPAPASPGLPQMIIDKTKSYTAVLHTTDGDITVELNAQATPITVNNFVWLAKKNFYSGTIFHRVIKGFMIQGGDPKGDGTGGPGYSFNDEPFTGAYTRGTIAMANAGPNTNGSQFFIMQADYPLPPNYVIFGHVVSGLDAVDKIATAPVELSPTGEMSKPVRPVTVNSVEVKVK